MRIVKASFDVLDKIDGLQMLKNIERAARACWQSSDKITNDSAIDFVDRLIKREHFSPLEHEKITVKFIVDRGVSHEIVRHRLASYSQESTRYCDYSRGFFNKEITVIEPCFLRRDSVAYSVWEDACRRAEDAYFALKEHGCTPQEARAVLPTSLKTELVMTANLREWRHFCKLRANPAAHPQMREVAEPLLEYFKGAIPVVFE